MSFKDFKNKYGEIISYLIVGVLSTVVSMSVYYGLVLTILDPNDAIMLQVANVISWVVSVTFAYFTNRKFVFKSKEKNTRNLIKYSRILGIEEEIRKYLEVL